MYLYYFIKYLQYIRAKMYAGYSGLYVHVCVGWQSAYKIIQNNPSTICLIWRLPAYSHRRRWIVYCCDRSDIEKISPYTLVHIYIYVFSMRRTNTPEWETICVFGVLDAYTQGAARQIFVYDKITQWCEWKWMCVRFACLSYIHHIHRTCVCIAFYCNTRDTNECSANNSLDYMCVIAACV